MDFSKNWDYSQRHIPEMIKIIKQNAMHLLKISIADKEKDTREATDLVFEVDGGTVAVRTRRCEERYYRDFTIRKLSMWGNKTELDKLREGFAKWYLYAWELKNNN